MGRYFGTDGARGLANEQITPLLAYKIGRYIGWYDQGRHNRILIARDTRLSGAMLAQALSSGIVASGSDVYDIGVSTTPSVSYLVMSEGFDFGVMISASHNPYYDNGIKIFAGNGEKIPAELEAAIEGYVDAAEDVLPLMTNAKIGRLPPARKLIDRYIDFLVSKADPRITGLAILCDCANGSASQIAPKLFFRLGLNVELVHATPDGLNINDHCGSTHIRQLLPTLTKGTYDAVFAFDGDADRCLAIDDQNRVVDGDAIIYLSALNMKRSGELKGGKVVLSIMSNLGLKKSLAKEGITYEETPVGDKYVQATLRDKDLSLGGEQSGHIIFADDLRTGDGLLTMIKILNVIATRKRSLSSLLKGLKIYPQCLMNTVVRNKEAIIEHQGLQALIEAERARLGEDGRILVRPSGTEQLIRVMCEAESDELCHDICGRITKYIEDLQ